MPDFSQLRDVHTRQKELFEGSHSSKLFLNRNELPPDVYYAKEIHLYKKWQQRETCNYTVGRASGHINNFKCGSIQSVPFTSLRKKRQTKITHQKKGRKKIVTTDLRRSAKMEIIQQSFTSSGIVTPRIDTANSSQMFAFPTQVRIRYRDNKRRHAHEQRRPPKIQIQSPYYYKVSQTDNHRQKVPETNSTPYAKTVLVYSVFNQKSTKREPRNTVGSNASFNIKFYRSMGNGRQMYGNNAPYVPIPRNYSPTNMARMGRDEDGCICMHIPQQPRCGGFNMGNYEGGSCLKRYFRVLLKEKKRCLCGKMRSKPKPCSYDSCSANYIPPPPQMDYQCRYNNASTNFHGNDVSCQCRCKERREQRPDRDIFCKDIGITCCVPKCPGVQSNNSNPIPINTANVPNHQTTVGPDKDAVNIGSNFSFQVGVYKRCLDNRPAPYGNTNYNNYMPARYLDINQPAPFSNPYYPFNNNMPGYDPNSQYMQNVQPGTDCSCSCSDASACREPKSGSAFSVLLRSREPSPCNSNDKASKSSLTSWSQFIKSQFERNDLCCNNLPKKYCKPKKTKAVRCRCDKKPKLIGCTDQNSVGILCSQSTSSQSASTCTGQRSNKIKNIGCNCLNVPDGILAPCVKQKKICCQCDIPNSSGKKGLKCFGKRNRKCKRTKSCECCPKEKKTKCCNEDECESKTTKRKKCGCKKDPTFFKILRVIGKLLQKESEGGCCRCKSSKKSCCCDRTSGTAFNLDKVPRISMLLQKIGNKCIKESDCKCSNKSGEFDYQKVLDSIKLSEQAKSQRCLCGDTMIKKIFSSQLLQVTKAQQCGCKDGSMKKKFGRLLLYNTVQPKPICCTSVSYDQNSRSIGTGEDDYRKVPPCRRPRVQDGSQGDGFALKKLVSKLIKPEKCCTRMHYSAFNPQNQCEAGVQHIGRIGPGERAGKETICREQGVECPGSKPTRKDCENAANACSQQDNDRRAVRLGSSCSFCLEFYKGAPPPKNAPPCQLTGSTQGPPCAATTTSCAGPEGDIVCCPKKTPCPSRQPIIKKALSHLILTQKKPTSKFTTTCQKCKKCVRVPLIKKGFAQLILRDKKPVTAPKTCQRTNTLQPTRRLVVHKPGAGGKGGRLGKSRNCDPYVCLKKINQRKCCNAR
ncbi:uncharacterized protein LOC125241085 [Leguminivora glycinivorella]|uniref:uncharacterized protein LOC125241085 n=1 Tax=Leguminivora glycinivorella TaxID=1035111 RepID=UPI00200BFA5C|nr:uncharacterized protein LOC125241085 [Leguminivora glycinivorella]